MVYYSHRYVNMIYLTLQYWILLSTANFIAFLCCICSAWIDTLNITQILSHKGKVTMDTGVFLVVNRRHSLIDEEVNRAQADLYRLQCVRVKCQYATTAVMYFIVINCLFVELF